MRKMYNSGVSLVEVMVAFALIGIAILPIISMYPAIFAINSKSTSNEEGSRVGMQIIEYLRATGYRGLIAKANNGYGKVYQLKLKEAASSTYICNDLANDFGFVYNNENFFFVNIKKGYAAENFSIYVAIKKVDADLLNPNTGGVEVTSYYRDFINGVIIVGTGKTGTGKTGRERETKLPFVLTPID